MIKTLSYAVTGQRIETTETAMLVAGTVNVYTARFAFDAEWDGLQRTAVFAVDGITREQLLEDDACTVPWEVLVAGNRLRVGVYGTKADGTRLPTIWTERRLYINPGAGPTQEAADPSPTLVEQLLGHIGDPANLKTEDKSSLVAAINEVQETGGGGGTSDHSKLKNRDAAGQHPMSAITGLEKALEGKQPTGNYLTEESDPTVPEWAKQPQKPSYTASEVGADPSGTATSQVAAHNTGTDTHSDIRALISGLTDRLNALADSDDTTLDQLSEIVAYIKSNRDLISAINTDKVSVADIVNNLTTNAANKPLSAAQGVALKALIDALTEAMPEAYTLPIASSTVLGGVKPVAKTDAMTQAVGLDAAGKLWTEPGSGGGSSSEVWDTIIDTELTQDTGAVRFTSDTSGNPFSLKEFKIFVVQPPIDGQTVNNRVAFAPNGNGWGGIGNVLLKSSPKETENTVYSFIHVNTVDRHMNLLTALVSSNYSSVRDILQENTARNNYDSTFTKKVNTTKNELNYLEMPVTSIGFVGITSVIFGAGTKILVRGIRS